MSDFMTEMYEEKEKRIKSGVLRDVNPLVHYTQ